MNYELEAKRPLAATATLETVKEQAKRPAEPRPASAKPRQRRGFVRRVLDGDATRDQAKDTGMAVVLILLLATVARRQNEYLLLALGVHLVNMIAPGLFRPLAVVWFGLSHALGAIASKVLMVAVFFAVVTPVAIWRRLAGYDSMQLKLFKTGRGSVMRDRNHTFASKDLDRPY